MTVSLLCNEGLNGSLWLIEGGIPTRSPLSRASCNQAGRNRLRLGRDAVFRVQNVAALIFVAEHGDDFVVTC